MCMCGSRVHMMLSLTKRVHIYLQHSKNSRHLNKGDKQAHCFYSATASSILSHSQQKLGYNEADSEKNDEEKHDRWWSNNIRD